MSVNTCNCILAYIPSLILWCVISLVKLLLNYKRILKKSGAIRKVFFPPAEEEPHQKILGPTRD